MATTEENLNRIISAKADIVSAIADKGVEVPSGAKIESLAGLISAISGGGEVIEGDVVATDTTRLFLPKPSGDVKLVAVITDADDAPVTLGWLYFGVITCVFSLNSTSSFGCINNNNLFFFYENNIAVVSRSSQFPIITGKNYHYVIL